MFIYAAQEYICDCGLSCCLHFIYASLFAYVWAQGWSALAFSQPILFSCWIGNLVSMTVSHWYCRAGPRAAGVCQVAKPSSASPQLVSYESPEKRHNSAVPGSIRAVWPQSLGGLWALGPVAGACHRGWCLIPYIFISSKANYVAWGKTTFDCNRSLLSNNQQPSRIEPAQMNSWIGINGDVSLYSCSLSSPTLSLLVQLEQGIPAPFSAEWVTRGSVALLASVLQRSTPALRGNSQPQTMVAPSPASQQKHSVL